jgi:hypothetical protein
MAIVEVKLQESTASAELSSGRAVEAANDTYLVRVDAITDPVAVRNSTFPGLPKVGSEHPSDSSMSATKISVDRDDDSHYVYYYKVTYSSDNGATSAGGSTIENPLNRPNRITWSGEESTEYYFRDRDDEPVVTSAGELFETMPERDRSDPVVTIVSNQATFDATKAIEYVNAVNSVAFSFSDGKSTWTVGTGVAKMGTIVASELKSENGVEYYEVTYPIKLRDDGWRDFIEDRGYKFLDANGKQQDILDGTQKKVTTPYPLDGSGGKKENATDTPASREFKPYNELPFSGLGW